MNVRLKWEDLCAFTTIKYPDFSLTTEKITFLNGPSGCGKSTLLKIINGTLTPFAGKVFLDNQEISTLDPIVLRRRVILAEQSVYLFSGTISDNFRRFHQYRNTPAVSQEKCQALLDICGLSSDLEELCDSMSGGERQRIFLAIALSMEPEVLLLDEPTSAMDSALAHIVMGNIIKYCRAHNTPMIIVSHDLELSNTYADEIIRLEGKP